MSLFSKFFKKDFNIKEPNEPNEIKKINVNQEEKDEITAVISAVLASMDDDEEEVIAAITAAITCILGTKDFIVRNIRRTSEIDSVWSMTGRMKLMR